MSPDRPEYDDPEYGARIQARCEPLIEEINRSSSVPDDLLEELNRLSAEYVLWATVQRRRDDDRLHTLHPDDAGQVAGGAPDFEGDDGH